MHILNFNLLKALELNHIVHQPQLNYRTINLKDQLNFQELIKSEQFNYEINLNYFPWEECKVKLRTYLNNEHFINN